jgi:cysteinyl-tRNA synthetase
MAAGLLVVLLLVAYVAVNRGLTHSLIKPAEVPAVGSVHFQYQDLDFQNLRRLPVDVLVIDPDDLELSPTEIGVLKQRDGGRSRLVLAYLSVGEAEEYREYWQVNWRAGSPDFIAEANPDWPGNYLVRYWDRRWRRVMEEEAARLADLGFDGAYGTFG